MSPAAASAIASLILRRRGGRSSSLSIFEYSLTRRAFSTQTLTLTQLDIKQTQSQSQIQTSRDSGNLDLGPRSFSSQSLTRRTKRVPSLLVPSRINPESCRSLFTLSRSREEKDGKGRGNNFLKYERDINLPEAAATFETRCMGSSEGILFTVKYINEFPYPEKSSSKLFAFDPLTGAHFPVPPPNTLSPLPGTNSEIPSDAKVILSPSHDMLVVTRGMQADVVPRLDDGEGGGWGCSRTLSVSAGFIDDIIFHKGLLYALHTYGLLSILDFNNPSSSGLPVSLSGNECLLDEENDLKYLVASPDGSDLYLVYKDHPPPTYFKVFKLNSEGKWTRVSSIGDTAIFVGINQSMSLSTTDFPDILKPNSIYFAEGDLVGFPETALVFSLEDESSQLFKLTYNGQDVLDWPDWATTIWLMPATTS